MGQRAAGILLHPTSLPGPHGIGELGPEATAFLDFLKETGQGLWQVLPLGPTGYGDSPYQSFCPSPETRCWYDLAGASWRKAFSPGTCAYSRFPPVAVDFGG